MDALQGRITLGSEMRRVLDSLRKRFGSFDYVWVAECPINAEGQPNPHVHLLTSVTVPRRDFAEYARWIEERWGLGYVKLERIRCADAAGRYMLKAVGYVSKGRTVSADIQGRRWGVSTGLRADETVEWIDVRATGRGWSNVCELFGGVPTPFLHGYFTGKGLVFDVNTGMDTIRSDALRLLHHGTAIVYGTDRRENAE